jgi:multidrug efflux pump subunit AcrB
MNFVDLLERHARSIGLIAGAFIVAGVTLAASLPVGLFPQVSFPRVVIDLSSGDRPVAQTALSVTRPVEDIVRTVPGVREVRSGTSRGSSQISVDFGWGRDMVATTLLVDAAVAQALPSLPAGTSYAVRRMDPTVFPIIAYALVCDTLPQAQVYDLAKLQIVPRLASIAGLAQVGVQGSQVAEIEVLTDIQRLSVYGLTLADLAAKIGAGNTVQVVGRVQERGKLDLIVTDSNRHTVADLGAIVIKSDPNGVVHLRDVADVREGLVPQWTRVVEDGRDAVLLNVYEQPDGNAVQIAREVRNRLGQLQLPPGVRLVKWYDQSELVLQSEASVRDAVLIGLVLAGLVLLAFLRNLRVMLIALIVVPGTLAVTTLLLGVLNMSFNIMTLGGIAAAVGLIIDDVIVMIEHIARRAGAAASGGGRAAVLPAAHEFLRPLTGSSLATLIVFVPLSFLSGVTGAFSKALSVTMGIALVVSYLMAAFLVPVLARRFIDFERWHDPDTGRKSGLARQHRRLQIRLFRRPALLLLAIVPLATIGAVAYTRVASGFMPTVDEGGFVLDFFAAPGTAVTETDRELKQIEAIILSNPDVETFSRRTGLGLGGSLSEPNHGDFFVRLKPAHAAATADVMSEVRTRIESEVPGVRVELAELMEDLIGDLTAVPQPIEIKLYAQDAGALPAVAKRVADALGTVAGVVDVKDGIVLAGDGIDVRIDAEKAAIEGMSESDVSSALNIALNGVVVTQLPQATKILDVRLRIPNALDLRQSDLLLLPLRAPDGHLVPLGRIATLVPVTAQPEISRDNLQPMLAVTARIEGRGLGAAVGDVGALLDRPGMLPPDVRFEMGGIYQQQQIAFAGLVKVFAAALAAEVILLMLLYEDMWLALIVVATSLLSTTAVFTMLWITGVELNITALMGMTMVIGIATEMAIFYMSEYTQLRSSMPPRRALRQASRNRLRPITMTTLAAILTLLPLAFAVGQGSAIQQPLALAIIAGLLVQYPMVLLAMPVLVSLTLRTKRT